MEDDALNESAESDDERYSSRIALLSVRAFSTHLESRNASEKKPLAPCVPFDPLPVHHRKSRCRVGLISRCDEADEHDHSSGLNLNGVRGAYAIYVIGDGMEPRYEQGWLLDVNPFKPPTRGRDVVVYKQDKGGVLIKQFNGWEGDALMLRQLNPARESRIPRGEVDECHLIVGVDQQG